MTSLSGIRFGGLVSGLDTGTLIRALVEAQGGPLRVMEARRATLERQATALGDVVQLLSDLRTSASALRDPESFVVLGSTTSSDAWLRAAAGPNAVAGSWDVVVEGLAKAQVNGSAGKADKDTTSYGSGVITITTGGVTRDIAVEGATLQGIADAINAADDLGVRADVFDTGAATDPFELVLTATETGAAHAFSVSAGPPGSSLEQLFAEVTSNSLVEARDAEVTVNGVHVQRSTNTLADVIPGVSLDLLATSGGVATRVSVAVDAEATGARIEEFVTAYNAVVDRLRGQSTLGAGGERPELFGDANLRTVRYGLRDVVGRPVDTGSPTIRMLADVGIGSDTAGRLSFDAERFAAALASDPDGVRALFSGDLGIASRIAEMSERWTDGPNAMLEIRREGIGDRIQGLESGIERARARLEALELRLENRFAELETLLARLQGQGSQLGLFE